MTAERHVPRPVRSTTPSLLHYWFVEYNPLYFFSAACVLLGVYLLSRGLEELALTRSQLILATCVQAYELLLIAGAALLFRGAAQRRPAVILGLLQVLFLFDATLQTEVLSTLGGAGRAAILAWVASVPLKLLALRWAFRLRVSLWVILLPTLAALGIAGTPYLLSVPGLDGASVHLAATWWGVVLLILAHELCPQLRSAVRLDPWGETVVRRVGSALWWIWGAFYLLHLGAWLAQFGLKPTLPHAAPLLVLGSFLFRSSREFWAWAGCWSAVATALAVPHTAAPTAALAGAALAWHAVRGQRPRLLVGAVLAFHCTGLTFGWERGALPPQQLWLGLGTAGALIILFQLRRLRTALLGAGLVLLPHVRMLVPRGRLELGIALVAVGFATLVLGVAINWNRRHLSLKREPSVRHSM